MPGLLTMSGVNEWSGRNPLLNKATASLRFSGAHKPGENLLDDVTARHVSRYIGAPTTLLGQYPLNAPTVDEMRKHMRVAKTTVGELTLLEQFLAKQGYAAKHPNNVWEMMVFVMNHPPVWRQLLVPAKETNPRPVNKSLLDAACTVVDNALLRSLFAKMKTVFDLSYTQNRSVLTVPEEDVAHGRYSTALLDTSTPPLRIYRGRPARPHRSNSTSASSNDFLPPSSGFTVPYFLNPTAGSRDGLAGDNTMLVIPTADEPPKRTFWLMRLMAPLAVLKPGRRQTRLKKTEQFPLILDAINDRINPSLRIRSRSTDTAVLITPAHGKPVRLMPGTSEAQRTFVTPAGTDEFQPLLIELEDDQHNVFVSAQPLTRHEGNKRRTQWLIKGYPKA